MRFYVSVMPIGGTNEQRPTRITIVRSQPSGPRAGSKKASCA